MNLEGKVAIVTGAAGGIGRSITRELADRGANVVAVDLERERIEVIAMEIREAGRKALAIQADVTNAEQVSQVISQTLATFQRIDILVNNAGGSGHIGVDQIEDISEELWDATVDLNLKAAFLCCKAVIPTMKAQKYGKIVNFSSSSAFGAFGPRGTSAARLPYASAKAGIIGFSSQLAKDLGPFGINVNTVIPGFINTGPDARVGQRFLALTEAEQDTMIKAIPLGRAGRAEEVAKVVAFLASDDASYMSSATVEVTGGRL